MFERLIALLVVVAGLLALGTVLNGADEPATRPAGSEAPSPEPDEPVPSDVPVEEVDKDDERKGDGKGRPG